MYQSAVKDPISAAYACDFWASMDHGTRGTDLRQRKTKPPRLPNGTPGLGIGG